ncbi:MAG: alginate lyase family protein [Candidatus Acidiferrales bacterium]
MMKWMNYAAVAALAFVAILSVHGEAPAGDLPRVFLLDAKTLAQHRPEPLGGSSDPIVILAIVAANMVRDDEPFSVMQKSVTPPSGDKHDYMSQATYYWPNPDTPNHLPYVRRDGERNPEILLIGDDDRMHHVASDANALALAFYLTGEENYAARAALLLRAWFLDPATRMNPNLNFAQAIPGVNTGRGIGIIDTHTLPEVVDAVGLLAESKSWTDADQKGMERWFAAYLDWLETNPHGHDESNAKNNHGTWFDVQAADFALFSGENDLAARILKQAETKRISTQIEPDGREPLELARTRSFDYSVFNVNGLAQLARLGETARVDLWHFETRDGRSIRRALDFLVPYATGEKKWPYKQISAASPEDLVPTLLIAARVYHDSAYAAAANRIEGQTNDPEILLLRAALP